MKNLNELDTKKVQTDSNNRVRIAQRMSITAKKLLEKVSKAFPVTQKNENK